VALPLLLVPGGAAGAVSPSRVTAAAAGATARPGPHNFSHSTRINNRWLPLAPGTQFVLAGRADRGQGLRPHRIVLIVTDLVKKVNGVWTVVAFERDYNGGRLAEAELFFEAQDNRGAVWNFGEYPEVYENGRFAGAPDTWIPGVDGAKAGIGMLAHPRVGTPAYVQGDAPSVEFLDKAKVSQRNQRLCVPAGCYRHVLVIDEWSPLDPGSGHQLKYYAPGVGSIRVGAVGGQQQEFLALVSVTHLSRAALATARRQALALERRAYRVSKVYRHTPPAERRRCR
jgi:hypothetical protein